MSAARTIISTFFFLLIPSASSIGFSSFLPKVSAKYACFAAYTGVYFHRVYHQIQEEGLFCCNAHSRETR